MKELSRCLPFFCLGLLFFPPLAQAEGGAEGETGAVVTQVVVGEFMMLGMSAMLAWEHEKNAKIYGGLLGAAGTVALAAPLFDDEAKAEFMVPLGLCYLGLAWYNWQQAADDAEAKVLRRNFLGLNLAAGLAWASATLLLDKEPSRQALNLYLMPNYLGLEYRF